MQILTARDAKNNFGEAIDMMQREPVLLTKNNRPIGAMVSLEDLKGTHIAELFMQPENGHDEWVKNKVEGTVRRLASNGSEGRPMDEVHSSIMDKVRERLASKG